MASIAWWWAIPVVALALAATWAWWTCRSARTPSMRDSMADYEEWSAVFDRVRDATPLGYERTDESVVEPPLEQPGESP